MIDSLRERSFAHPRLRGLLREGWGASRRSARHLGMSSLLEPEEFKDLGGIERDIEMPTPSGPRILCLSFRGWSTHLMWESILGMSLRLRAADPFFVTCGGRLPICDAANRYSAPPMPCVSCAEYAISALASAGFEARKLGAGALFKTGLAHARENAAQCATLSQCEAFTYRDLPIGRLVRSSVAWFMARGSLPETTEVLSRYQDFLTSGQLLADAFEDLLERERPARIFMLNGNFFAERILVELATHRRIPFTTYERGFLTDTLFVTPEAAASDFVVDEEVWREASGRDLTASEDERLDSYLADRRRGAQAIDNLWPSMISNETDVLKQIGIATGGRFVAAFPNILWDSAVQNRDIAFASAADWVTSTIAGFRERPEVDLVIRIHPAEVRLENHKAQEKFADVIHAKFPTLPPNVHIVPADSPLSSYVLMDRSELGLVYTTTVGLEMAIAGSPVVLPAQTHYRGRGFTDDVDSESKYWHAVDRRLADGSSDEDRARHRVLARRYANLFFFRYMQPLDLVTETSRGRPRVVLRRLSDLAPGSNAVLDRICRGILEGAQVLSPAGELP